MTHWLEEQHEGKIVQMLYDSGAKEVHVRIACPEIKFTQIFMELICQHKKSFGKRKIMRKCANI